MLSTPRGPVVLGVGVVLILVFIFLLGRRPLSVLAAYYRNLRNKIASSLVDILLRFARRTVRDHIRWCLEKPFDSVQYYFQYHICRERVASSLSRCVNW